MRHRLPRTLAALAAGVLVASAAPLAGAQPADPPGPPLQGRDAAEGAPGRDAVTETVGKVTTANPQARGLARAYPRQQVLEVPPVNPADASIRLGLIPYHAIAPKLNELQAASSRVSVEVIGQSVLGRDLHLVTVTSPESPGEARQQEDLRLRMKNQAAQAASDSSIPKRYKAPVFINNNIHGNEWEGTDAALRVIEELALSTDASVGQLLDRTRLYFVITQNPDGRVVNTRANANGFDMNRDFITASQPENRAVRQALIDTQPLVMLDLHGYVNGTLIEPTTPPHGENYEYDLFIKHAYPNGLGMEAAVNGLGYRPGSVATGGDGVNPVQIPFRDRAQGWDDWPPIFTPQYAAFHGAVSHTIEFPLSVNGGNYNNLSVAELQRRTAINTDIGATTMRASIQYTDTNREELIADQIEIFRRGAAGEAQRPVPLDYFGDGTVGPEDIWTTEFPRAYVIPAGDDQRSAPAAARLVDFLVANDVQVTRADKSFVAGGTSYPAGSYVVDMHQPKRGLANVILADGSDVSTRVSSMYDISGWSHRLLWGATADIVEGGELRVVGKPVVAAGPTGAVSGSGDLVLEIEDPKDVEALNALLEAGADVAWLGDGSVRVTGASAALVRDLADRFGVVFTPAEAADGPALRSLVVATSAPADEIFALREMGFTTVPVTNAIANGGFDWSSVDALYVGNGNLTFAGMNAAARSAFRAWLADGGGVVGRGSSGNTFNGAYGLLPVTRVAGQGAADGVVRVTSSGGPISAGAMGSAFVNGPSWFTNLGAGVDAEQRYSTDGPLVSGFWTASGNSGQAAARGQAAVVRGVDDATGAGVVLFGTEPLYRAHPKGTYALVAKALHWTASVVPASAPASAGSESAG